MYIYSFQTLFPYRLLQNIEYSSLCYTEVLVGYLFYMQQGVCVNPNLLIYPSPTPFPFGNHKFVFYVLESLSVLQISSFASFFFLISHISDIVGYLSFSVWLTSLSMIISRHISRENYNSKRYMHPSVHCSTIYSSQDMEAN